DCSAFSHCGPRIRVGERHAPQLKSGSACLADPAASSISGPENCPAFTYCCSGVCVSKRDVPEILRSPAMLNRPALPAIRRADNRPIKADHGAGIRIDERCTAQVVALRKRVLPEPVASLGGTTFLSTGEESLRGE